MSAIASFLDELRRDPHLASRAGPMEEVFEELDFCSFVIPEACALYDNCLWILNQQRTAEEKLNMMVRLNCEGKSADVTMRQFTGWDV